MNKRLFLLLLLTSLFSKADVTIIVGMGTKVEEVLVKFQTTDSSAQSGPNINDLIKKNRNFFAKFIEKRLALGIIPEIKNRWFLFENNDDANSLQRSCYNYKKDFYNDYTKGSMIIEWYYLDYSLSSEEKK